MLQIIMLTIGLILIGMSHGYNNLNIKSDLSIIHPTPTSSNFYRNWPVNTLLKSQTLLYSSVNTNELVGEDAAVFSLSNQNLKSWGIFSGAVAAILSALFYIWIYSDGPKLGDQYLNQLEQIANGDSTGVIVLMLLIFAIGHSGLASLRPYAENVVGPRLWRVIFASYSLPLAFSAIVYFINHRYDGIQLWDLRLAPGMHDFVWWSSLISFFFLYPSTFNLLEVAAVDKPQLHLWETGITRITRHPQAIGQLIWCTAHTAYIGSSFMIATSFMLCAHHFFAVWNGDRRLQEKFGERAEILRERTSIIPFAAILSGKQQLPPDYYKEFLRLPYATILIGSVLAYYAHPYMQSGATLLHW